MLKKHMTVNKVDNSDRSINDMRRIPVRFRLAADLDLHLSDICRETGQKKANLIEAIVTDYLAGPLTDCHQVATEKPVDDNLVTDWECLSTYEIYMLFFLFIRSKKINLQDEIGFSKKEIFISYFSPTTLFLYFQKFMDQKNILMPTLDELFSAAKKGYRLVGVFGRSNWIHLTDDEIDTIKGKLNYVKI